MASGPTGELPRGTHDETRISPMAKCIRWPSNLQDSGLQVEESLRYPGCRSDMGLSATPLLRTPHSTFSTHRQFTFGRFDGLLDRPPDRFRIGLVARPGSYGWRWKRLSRSADRPRTVRSKGRSKDLHNAFAQESLPAPLKGESSPTEECLGWNIWWGQVSIEHDLQSLIVQDPFGQQLLQLPVLFLEGPPVCLLTRCRFVVSAFGVESVRCCKPGEHCTPEILRVLTQISGVPSKPPTFPFPAQTLSSKP